MEFYTPWKQYTIAELDRFDLGRRIVYVAQDRTCVFIADCHDSIVREARRAGEQEISQLWEEHRLISLLPVFRTMNLARRSAPTTCDFSARGSL